MEFTIRNKFSVLRSIPQLVAWAVAIISFVLDASHKLFLARVQSVFFREVTISLNIVRVIWFISTIALLKLLYDKFISKKKLVRIVNKFCAVFDNFTDFVSIVYGRRESLSETDKKQYQKFQRKLSTLFSYFSSALFEYLRSYYQQEPNWVRSVYENIENSFCSPTIEEHFKKNRSKPPDGYYENTKRFIRGLMGFLRKQ